MLRSLINFACSRVHQRAAKLQGKARATFLRRLVYIYGFSFVLSIVLVILSLVLQRYAIVNRAGYGYIILFALCCLIFGTQAHCFFALSRYAYRESKNAA